MANKTPFAGQVKPHHTTFVKLLRGLSSQREPWRVFADFCELAACTFHNALAPAGAVRDAREARYLEIIKHYDAEAVQVFPRLIACVVDGLEGETGNEIPECDFLGEVFQALEFDNHWHGQFFTPMALARACAEVIAPHNADIDARPHGFVRALEPACGAGAMILGLVAAMRARGLNPQTQLHVTAIEVDRTAAMMCYVQCALWHIPALVCVGNTLTDPEGAKYDVWPTPAHYIGLWDMRLRCASYLEAVQTAVGNAGREPNAEDVQQMKGVVKMLRKSQVVELVLLIVGVLCIVFNNIERRQASNLWHDARGLRAKYASNEPVYSRCQRRGDQQRLG